MVYVCEMKQIKFIVGVLLPLLTGSFIYILFRVETLKMFSWFIKLGIQEEIELLRITFSFIRLPYWILFVLPDGLWLFSFISFQQLVWNLIINRVKVFLFLIVLKNVEVAKLCIELCQSFKTLTKLNRYRYLTHYRFP